MMMELEAGDAGKQSFANHVPGEAQHHCVIRSAGDVFTQRFKTKFGDVNSTQQSARKLCLIDQFFAAFKWQWLAPGFLAMNKDGRQRQQHQRDDGEEGRFLKTTCSHLK